MMIGVIVGNLRQIARDHNALQTVTGCSKRPAAIQNQGYLDRPDQLQPHHQGDYYVALS